MPGGIYGYQGCFPFRDQLISAFSIELEAEGDGFVLDAEDEHDKAQFLRISYWLEKFAFSLNDWKSEAFVAISEHLVRDQAVMFEEFLDTVVAISKIGCKVDHSIRVGVSETYGYGKLESIRCDSGQGVAPSSIPLLPFAIGGYLPRCLSFQLQ